MPHYLLGQNRFDDIVVFTSPTIEDSDMIEKSDYYSDVFAVRTGDVVYNLLSSNSSGHYLRINNRDNQILERNQLPYETVTGQKLILDQLPILVFDDSIESIFEETFPFCTFSEDNESGMSIIIRAAINPATMNVIEVELCFSYKNNINCPLFSIPPYLIKQLENSIKEKAKASFTLNEDSYPLFVRHSSYLLALYSAHISTFRLK